MKINKDEFQDRPTDGRPERSIEKLIYPFIPQMVARNMNVYVTWKKEFHHKMEADWKKYSLILFNMIQNAVKYNNMEGDMLIILSCKCTENGHFSEYMLETEVIDTGIGITKERQEMLFKPFLELKFKQNIDDVNDNSIGMGLACSKQIACKLGGDIMIKHSEPNLTIFCFKIPVDVARSDEENEYTWKYSSGRNQNIESIGSNLLRNYVKTSKISSVKQMEFSEEYFLLESRKKNYHNI